MLLTPGRAPVLFVSTYSNVDAGPGLLERSLVSVTITSTGPEPSRDAGEPAGSVSRAAGIVTVREVEFRTWIDASAACQAPT